VTSMEEQVQARLAGKSRVRRYVGTFVAMVGRTATVDLANGRITGMSTATPYRPQVNDTVWVEFVDGVPLMLGPAVMPPDSGVVVTVSAASAVVTTDLGDVRATYNVGDSISSGQSVKLMWSAGAHIIGVMSSVLTPPAPPPPPVIINPVPHLDVFTATAAGSWNEKYGWTQQQVWASADTLGAWFYGSKIRDTLAGASIQKVELFATPTHLEGNAQDGPVLSNSTPVAVSTEGWVMLPTAFGEFLAQNIGGIGLNHGGMNKFRSLREDAQTGALRITSIY
jgi:hypothetical protein